MSGSSLRLAGGVPTLTPIPDVVGVSTIPYGSAFRLSGHLRGQHQEERQILGACLVLWKEQ